MLARPLIVLLCLLATIVLAAAPASAGPQDDSERPVEIAAGDSRFLSDATLSLTLTLDGAANAGLIEPGKAEQAKTAAAAAQGEVQLSDVGQESAGNGSAGSSGGGAGVGLGECGYRAASVPAGDSRWGGNDPAAGTLLVDTCNGQGEYLFVPNPAPGDPAVAAPPPPPPPDPAVLAQQAYGELSLPRPQAHRSPDETNSDPALGGLPYTFVGLHTWTWVDNWQPLQRTVELRGVSATVTATPTALKFDPGNGDAPVSCAGPGRPWTEADGNRPPTGGGCAYVYRKVTPAGPLTATTGITWSVAWTSNTGAGGAFPALTTTTTSSFLVEQIQVVVQR